MRFYIFLLVFPLVCSQNTPRITAYTPMGLKVCFNQRNIQTVTFSANINKNIKKEEVGDIFFEIEKNNKRFCYSNKNITLKFNDVISYWYTTNFRNKQSISYGALYKTFKVDDFMEDEIFTGVKKTTPEEPCISKAEAEKYIEEEKANLYVATTTKKPWLKRFFSWGQNEDTSTTTTVSPYYNGILGQTGGSKKQRRICQEMKPKEIESKNITIEEKNINDTKVVGTEEKKNFTEIKKVGKGEQEVIPNNTRFADTEFKIIAPEETTSEMVTDSTLLTGNISINNFFPTTTVSNTDIDQTEKCGCNITIFDTYTKKLNEASVVRRKLESDVKTLDIEKAFQKELYDTLFKLLLLSVDPTSNELRINGLTINRRINASVALNNILNVRLGIAKSEYSIEEVNYDGDGITFEVKNEFQKFMILSIASVKFEKSKTSIIDPDTTYSI